MDRRYPPRMDIGSVTRTARFRPCKAGTHAHAHEPGDVRLPDCLIVGYEALASTLRLPDPNDRHVLAAAIAGGCDMIVTANLADFPGKIVARHGIVTSSPDDFLVRRLVSASAEFCEAAKTIRRRLKSPPLTVDRYLANPGRSGSVETASALRRFAARLRLARRRARKRCGREACGPWRVPWDRGLPARTSRPVRTSPGRARPPARPRQRRAARKRAGGDARGSGQSAPRRRP